MMQELNSPEVILNSCRLYWAPSGIVTMYLNPIELDLASAQEIKWTMRDMADLRDAPIYTIFDVRKIKRFTKEARDFFSHDPSPRTKAAAIIVGSGFSKLAANFMLGLNRPKFPMKAFNSEEKAEAFLLSLMD